jgi:hypothetical protein
LQVLIDGQLDHRWHGLDVRLGIGESYLLRDEAVPVADGRIETVFGLARYGRQAPGGDTEIVGTARARQRVLAPDGEPAPWLVDAAATYARYFYGDAWDPIGALQIGAELGAASDDLDGVDTATRIAGTVGWLWARSRASRYRLAGTVALEAGEIFVGASFEARYGLLDAGFVSPALYPAR